MKRKVFWILVTFFGVVILSCNVKKHATKTTTLADSVKTEKRDSLKPFEQRFKMNLSKKDTVTFYNDVVLLIEKSEELQQAEEHDFIENGVIYSVDSNRVAKKIPIRTPMKISDVNYKIISNRKTCDFILVTCKRKEVVYFFTVCKKDIAEKTKTAKNPDSFIFSTTGTVKYNGKEYNIKVVIPNPPCYLLVDFRKFTEPQDDNEGWEMY
ncbi:MAG: hypothetical protein WC666_04735 [Candidatus Paceibacterota bacterium]|jgi:hypothetical protein